MKTGPKQRWKGEDESERGERKREDMKTEIAGVCRQLQAPTRSVRASPTALGRVSINSRCRDDTLQETTT